MLKPLPLTISCLALLSLFACNPRTSQKTTAFSSKELHSTLARSDFGELGHLSNANGITFYKEQLFVPDFEGKRVLMFNRDLEPIRAIGRGGEGPGELVHAGLIAISKDRLFVHDGATARFTIYDIEGAFLDAVPLSQDIGFGRFTTYDDLIYFASHRTPEAITAIDHEGNVVFKFGEQPVPDDFERIQNRIDWHLSITEVDEIPYLVAISVTDPVLRIYTPDGTLLHELQLETLLPLKPYLEGHEDFYKNPANIKSSKILFTDLSTSRDQILAAPYGDSVPHKILRFEIKEQQLQFKDVLFFNDPIAFYNITYDGENRVYTYDLKHDELLTFEPIKGGF